MTYYYQIMTDIVFEPIYIKNSTQNIKNSTQINEIKTDFVKPMHSFSDIFDPTLAYLLFAKKNNTCITIFAIIFFYMSTGNFIDSFFISNCRINLIRCFSKYICSIKNSIHYCINYYYIWIQCDRYNFSNYSIWNLRIYR